MKICMLEFGLQILEKIEGNFFWNTNISFNLKLLENCMVSTIKTIFNRFSTRIEISNYLQENSWIKIFKISLKTWNLGKTAYFSILMRSCPRMFNRFNYALSLPLPCGFRVLINPFSKPCIRIMHTQCPVDLQLNFFTFLVFKQKCGVYRYCKYLRHFWFNMWLSWEATNCAEEASRTKLKSANCEHSLLQLHEHWQ